MNQVYLVAEVLHVVENFVHCRHHVLPVDNHWHIAPVSQSNMENCTVLGEVDLFTWCVIKFSSFVYNWIS